MNKRRIHLLDELRGVCVILMVIYHALYTLASYFGLPWALKCFQICYPLEPLFAGIFIALCGFSCRLSRSNWRRGLCLAAVAVGVTLVLWLVMPSQIIWFGVLHCLAVCILLFQAAKPLLDRVKPLIGVIGSATLFALLWSVPTVFGGRFLGIPLPESLLSCQWLFALGFGRLYSADYFPLIPWAFCFLGGTFLGQWHERLPSWCYVRHNRAVAWIGRHSLILYLVHQPLLFGVGAAIVWILG